jgi:small GTP-binding protein
MSEEPLMDILKIVVTGAYAAGKTQFIRTISEIEVVETEEEASSEEERLLKSHTTVALDFGTITVNEHLALYLFGTPGQERFDFMWEILSLGCIGYIVMIDSCRPAHFKEAIGVIRHFNAMIDVPFVVAANKQDDPTALPLDYIRRRLGLDEDIPVLSCVATDRESVKEVLLTLLDRIYSINETT